MKRLLQIGGQKPEKSSEMGMYQKARVLIFEKFSNRVLKDQLWPAGLVALTLHGAMVTAFALCHPHYGKEKIPTLHVDVIFCANNQEKVATKRNNPQDTFASPPPRKNKPNKTLATQTDETKKLMSSFSELKEDLNQDCYKDSKEQGEANISVLSKPSPVYPLEARRKGIQGVVYVRLFVTQIGTVEKATALSPHIDPLLEEAALKAVRLWRFKPGVMTLDMPIEFKLEG